MEIIITEVDEVYDGPLSGDCLWQDKKYYFYSFDQLKDDGSGDPFPSKYALIDLTEDQLKQLEKERLDMMDIANAGKDFPRYLINKNQILGWFSSVDPNTKERGFLKSYFKLRAREDKEYGTNMGNEPK